MPFCHPPVTLVTLKTRVHPQCLSAFCHPDTLKHKIFCIKMLIDAGLPKEIVAENLGVDIETAKRILANSPFEGLN